MDCRDNVSIRTCFTCGEDKPITKGGTKNCRDCWSLIRPRKSTALVMYVKPKHGQPRVIHVKTSSRLTAGQCRVCSAWFISHHLDVTCSDECKAVRDREQKRIHKDRRRAYKRDAYRADVYRHRVFEADGYRCHLCRRKTDPSKLAPHPRSPTIDHVIPLSRGGTHEPVNCRTACFLCNSLKSAGGSGEQMLLIAV